MDSAWHIFENMPATYQKKLYKRIKEFIQEKEKANDPTLMSKEEFEAKVLHSEQQAKEGKVRRFDNVEQLDKYIRGL